MRYIKPQIIGNFPAVSTIKSNKLDGEQEIMDPSRVTNGAAYQADE